MSIEIKTKLIIGYRFSDLCVVEEDCIKFITEKLKEATSKKFEENVIDPKEISPEFFSILFNLDFVDFSNKEDGIIGKKIEETNIGVNDQEVRNFREIEASIAEIKTKIETIDSEITNQANIKISIVSSTRIRED